MTPKTKEQFDVIRQQSIDTIKTTALELFAQHGFANTSVSKIAKEAGISKGLMYNYFESKEDLLHQIITDAMNQGEAMMRHFLAQELSPIEKLEQLIEASFNMVQSNLDYWRLMTSLVFQPSASKNFQSIAQQRYQAALRIATDLFEKAGHQQAEQSAIIASAAMDGIFLQYMTLGETYPLQEMKIYLINIFIKKQEK